MFRRLWRRTKTTAKAAIFAVGRRVPAIRRGTRRFLSWRGARAYRRMVERNPLQRNLVIFECYAGRAYACSPRAIYQAMCADDRFRDFEFVWAFRDAFSRPLCERLGKPEEGKLGYDPKDRRALDVDRVFGAEALDELGRARIVRYGSREYYEIHSQATCWIANYILPTHLVPREGQVYLQTWHGTPLKRLGCDLGSGVNNATFEVDEIHHRYAAEGRRMTYLVSPSPFATEKLTTAFNLVNPHDRQKVLEIGYPRNDFLRSATAEQVASIRRRLGIPDGKRTILYCPTFRDDQHSSSLGYTYQTEIDFDRLQRELGDDYAVLFRAHYLVANKFDFARYRDFVYDVSDLSDVNELYVVSEVLVTDYSSVFFDFANLGRPTIFYMYDLERYAEDLRGFYLDLSELPGPIVRTEEELVATVRAAEHPTAEEQARVREFSARFNPLDDGRAADRAITHVFPTLGQEAVV